MVVVDARVGFLLRKLARWDVSMRGRTSLQRRGEGLGRKLLESGGLRVVNGVLLSL